jgi:excisionase family DNA binding protein
MPQTHDLPELLTVREFATALRLDVSSVYRMARAGELRAVRISTRPGSSVRIPRSELVRVLAPLEEGRDAS